MRIPHRITLHSQSRALAQLVDPRCRPIEQRRLLLVGAAPRRAKLLEHVPQHLRTHAAGQTAAATAEAAAAKGGGRLRGTTRRPSYRQENSCAARLLSYFANKYVMEVLRDSRLEHAAIRAEGIDHEVVNLARLLQQRIRAQRRRVPLPAPTPAGQHKTRVRHKDQSQHKGSEAAQGCGTRVAEAWPLACARTSSSSSSKPFPTICRPPTFMCTFGQVASSVMHALHSASFVASALKDKGPARPPQWSQMIVREGQAVARSFKPRRT